MYFLYHQMSRKTRCPKHGLKENSASQHLSSNSASVDPSMRKLVSLLAKRQTFSVGTGFSTIPGLTRLEISGRILTGA